MSTAFDLNSSWRTNSVEVNQEEIVMNGKQLKYQIKPFQILTLRLVEKAR